MTTCNVLFHEQQEKQVDEKKKDERKQGQKMKTLALKRGLARSFIFRRTIPPKLPTKEDELLRNTIIILNLCNFMAFLL
uniref:Uncharacterized protein n=1 Tax=Romanomermis culicivorax TaxID=13658 RepID=A0A915I986_ROMCU